MRATLPVLVLCIHLVMDVAVSVTGTLQPSRFDITRLEDVKISLSCGGGFQKNRQLCKGGGVKRKAEDCTSCDPAASRIELAFDGDHKTRWRSLEKSVANELQELNITVMFNQKLIVNRLVLITAESPLPAIWAIEQSRDHGKTFEPWRFFVPSPQDCLKYFGLKEGRSLVNSKTNSPDCVAAASGGHYASEQMQFVAFGVRLRFLQMDGNSSQKFYSIRELAIHGRCACNGHADSCKMSREGVMQCRCRHNTCGVNCDKCCSGFERTGASDGPCLVKNTENILMRDDPKPRHKFCFCNRFATNGRQCNPTVSGGYCRCKPNFRGRRCDRCAPGYYQFPLCFQCGCSLAGSYHLYCNSLSGKCPCKPGMRGRTCSTCPKGYYNFPTCQWCACNPLSVTSDICDNSGQCICKANYEGHMCGQCKKGYYDFPFCTQCACSKPGSVSACGVFGQCVCKNEYSGSTCHSCKGGYYGYPNCTKCDCNEIGSTGSMCEKSDGRCQCLPGVRGARCDRCEPGKIGFPKCKKCSCNTAGVRRVTGKNAESCYSVDGKRQCLCKSHVEGLTCDTCSYGYYNLNGSNPQGCLTCRCHYSGSLAASRACHTRSGKCGCKAHVTGLQCRKCKDGYYGMGLHDVFGCHACQCNPGGSLNPSCNKQSGQCVCRPWISGKKCDRLVSALPKYIPTLHHIKTELEDSLTHDRLPVRTGSSRLEFPSFSGTGYMYGGLGQSFSIQITIPRTSQYRVVFNYVLARRAPTVTKIQLTPIAAGRRPRHVFQAIFQSTKASRGVVSRLMTVKSNRVRPFELGLTAGQWKVSITARTSLLLLDYIVFVPKVYFSASILREIATVPCEIQTGKEAKHCDMYVHYNTNDTSFVKVKGKDAYVIRGRGSRSRLQLYRHTKFLARDMARLGEMALFGRRQTTLYYYIILKTGGAHNLVVEYFHHSSTVHRSYVIVAADRGVLVVQPCRFIFGCRQVVSTGNRVKSFNLKSGRNTVRLLGSAGAKIGIISLTAIPANKWSSEYLKPSLLCRSLAGSCIVTSYHTPGGTVKLTETRSVKPKDTLQGDDSGAQNTVELSGRFQLNGFYYITIHYRQPKTLSMEAEMKLTLNNRPFKLSQQFTFCQANDGCRVMLGEGQGVAYFVNKQRPTIEITTARPFLVEYILLIPKASYNPRVTLLQAWEKPAEFINKCGKNHFKVNSNPSQFCFDSVFALTMHFNQGPLSCRCNREGSNGAYCQEYGGQCPCAPHVVGRSCDRCATGYSGFPYCERCSCNLKGSTTRYCDNYGTCKCKPGFGGRLCDRCLSAVFYGFPKCRPCGCNNRGSLGLFCRSRDGQCQCLRNFDGLKCDRCRIGFFNFPRCQECSCKAEGIKAIPGRTNSCGAAPGSSKCTCKDNVQGKECDECKDLFFNLQLRNPDGCQSCQCLASGTVGEQRLCKKETGQCTCKAHVTGRRCDECKQGYRDLVATDLFGCKRCTCNRGGAYGPFCDRFTGQCNCRRNVAGDKCDRVASGRFYYPDLHHIKFEFEDGKKQDNTPVTLRHSDTELPGYSWRGYVPLKDRQTTVQMLIDVPQSRKYRVIIRYKLSQVSSVSATIRFIPTVDSGLFPRRAPAVTQQLTPRFQSTASWVFSLPDFHVVNDKNRKPAEVFLSRGKWKLVVTAPSSKLLLDYLVLLPEQYYKPTVLKNLVINPCEVNKPSKFCLHYTYQSLKRRGVATVEAETGTPRSMTRIDKPFKGVLLNHNRVIVPRSVWLSVSRPVGREVYEAPLLTEAKKKTITLGLPRTLEGKYVLLVKYYHDSNARRILSLIVRTGRTIQRAIMPLLTCRYTFGCRQIALDNQHKVKHFTFVKNRTPTVTFITTHAVSLDHLTAVPVSQWESEYQVPAQQCIRKGSTCISATFSTPEESVVVQAENETRTGPEVRKPLYMLDHSIKLEYIVRGQKILYIRSTIPPGRYLLVVHYFQPHFLSYEGKVIVTSGIIATSAQVNFRYCPYVSGCRSLGMSQGSGGRKKYFFIGSQSEILFTVVIPEDKSIWIDYVMLVSSRAFSQSLLEADPVDLTSDFMQECSRQSYLVKPSASKFCLNSVFSLTTYLNNGAQHCNCNSLGSLSDNCQAIGGQCRCRRNVIGRVCDRCKSGYRNFPRCKHIKST